MGKAQVVQQEMSIDQIRTNKKNQINNTCQQGIIAGMQSSVVLASTGKAHFYSTDRDDQRNFMGKHAILMQDVTIRSVNWKTEDTGVFEEHTRNEFLQICVEVMNHIENNIGVAVIKKAQVDQALTIPDVLAI